MILSSITEVNKVIDLESSVIKREIVQTWIQPEADNEYYSEYLDINVLKDGSISKEWYLNDHGIGDISFPINLTTPVNSSTLALEDLRVRLAIVQHDEFSQMWGPITYRDTSYEFLYDDEIESIVSHLFLEFYVLMDDPDNDTIIYPLLEDMVSELESLWNGVRFFKFGESFSSGGRRITQTWRAFTTSEDMRAIFEDIITKNLPSSEGLFELDDTERFLDANHKSIHIVANWDGMNESGSDSFDQEPYINGLIENLDERWEFIAGISLLESEYLTIEYDSLNTLRFKDIIPFTGGLTSHPRTNSSYLDLNLFHGSEIINARPKFESSPRYKTRYLLDMLSDSGEGANYVLQDYSHVNFTDGVSRVPVLTTKVTSDKYNVMPGENITLTYEISNIGEVSAYDIFLEDNFNYGFPVNYSIMEGDPDNDYTVEESWNTIENGSSEIFTVKIYCNTTAENGSFLWIDPELEYHASNYADENLWARNPRDYYGGYQVDGSEIIILCNVTSPILLVEYNLSATSFMVGEQINVEMKITNVGNNATDFDWQFPELGINTSAINGHIDFLDSSETISVESSFIVDYPERFLGDFVETDLFSDAYVDYQFVNNRGSLREQFANEIPLNIYPQVEQSYGALIQLSKSIIDLAVVGENLYQVTITAMNVGDTSAYFVDIDDNYPIENFTIISGTNSIAWDYLPPNMQFSYSYVVKYPETIDSTIQVSYVTASYDFAYNWYSGSSWEGTYDFNPLSRGAGGTDDFIPFVLGLGFLISTVAAVALGVLLLREKGMV
jgi:uncharacterized repeat protein (TIGR01451 family)